MADQASVRGAVSPGARSAQGTGNGNGNGVGVVGSITDFGNDVTTLIELQAKLTALDLKESKDHLIFPLSLAVVAVVVVLGAVPVALLGVADLLATALNVAPGWSRLLIAGLTLAVAGVIGFLSVKEIGRSLEPLRRSREELARNLAWLRTVLVYSGRSTPRRGL